MEHAASLGASEDVQWAVRLAVSEAVTNVVRHAYVGREVGTVSIGAHLDGDGVLVVLVDDDGVGPVPRMDSPGSGFGLGLVAACTLSYELGGGANGRGSHMAMRFALSA